MATILIVDDDPHMSLLVKTMLGNTCKNSAHQIFIAENGKVAVEILAKEKIDLIITDLVMPEKNGIDLIMEVRQSSPDIKILAMSGGGGINGRFDYLPIAKLIGAENILRKPFKREELCAVVAELVA